MFKNLSEKEKASRLPKYRKTIRWVWALIIAGILGVIGLFILLSYTDLPTIEELENPKSELASEIYSTNGQVLGRYYVENRVPIDFEQLSPNVTQALLATEDERYFDHCGIDFEALGRVMVKTILQQDASSGGASTITQQLAKLLFTKRPGSGLERVTQKLKEWIIALRLEKRYTKKEIIAMYLNKFDFLYDSDGIKAAAETYFGKDQKDLKKEEAALLVGMLKNPALYNPKRYPERAIKRREIVLNQTRKNGLITRAQYDSLRVLPLDMSNFKRSSHAEGLAPHFRMELAKWLKSDILEREECRKPDGSKYNIYRDGLKIYTTIDAKMQAIAEEVMLKHMKDLQQKFWNTWKWHDPWTYSEDSETEIPVEIRKQGLQKLIWDSERYQSLRVKRLGPSLTELTKEVDGFDLRDVDIERLLSEEEKKGSLKALERRKLIQPSLTKTYQRILSSNNWKTVRSKWHSLQKETKEIFDKKTKMKVFAYNDQMEKDTILSPLDSIKYHRMFLQTGSLAVDPITGHIKVWIGGINHKYFQFDHTTTRRQVGSTFKPFVYATAINLQGISPCFTVYDQAQTIAPGDGNFGLQDPWTPANSHEKYTGELVTLKDALKRSINTVSVYLMKQLNDAKPVVDLVSNMGVTRSHLPVAPSIALGSCDLTVQELTGAYTTFANNGIANKPIFAYRIEDKDGRVIHQELPEEKAALSPNANYVMVEMLKYAVQGSYGFAGLKSEYGGKTGTTNDFVDGWFMGITPSLVVGTWAGGEDRWIRFRSIEFGQGARMARPFFSGLLQALEKSEDIDYDAEARFARPSGNLGIIINCDEYKYDVSPDQENQDDPEYTPDPFGDEDMFGDEEEDDEL